MISTRERTVLQGSLSIFITNKKREKGENNADRPEVIYITDVRQMCMPAKRVLSSSFSGRSRRLKKETGSALLCRCLLVLARLDAERNTLKLFTERPGASSPETMLKSRRDGVTKHFRLSRGATREEATAAAVAVAVMVVGGGSSKRKGFPTFRGSRWPRARALRANSREILISNLLKLPHRRGNGATRGVFASFLPSFLP